MALPAAISKALYLTDRQLAGTGRHQIRIDWRDIYRRLVEDAPEEIPTGRSRRRGPVVM
jgi:hypothetical protein